MKKYYLIIYLFILIIFLSGVFILGTYLGYEKRPSVEKIISIFNKESEVITQTDFDPFWKVWNLIDEKYPSASNVSDQERVWGSIYGLLSSLDDPYTVFFKPGEAKMFEENVSGEFEGVGMEIGIRDKILTIVAPLKDTPAYKAGIKAGDKIIKIDDKPSINMNIDEAAQLIRGKKGTPVKLTLVREGEIEPKEIEITRDKINIPTLETEIRPDGVFIINLYNFSSNSPELFKEALEEFIISGFDKLILDLRNNPGGYMWAAIDITDWFIPKGEIIVIEDKGEKYEKKFYRSTRDSIFNENLKFVVLVNEGSASGSEIVAGALQEHGVATLVGTKTFGKGSVQELIPVSDDTSLKITIAKWLTPNEVSISDNGLIPDVVVEMTKEDYENDQDPQIDKAMEILMASKEPKLKD